MSVGSLIQGFQQGYTFVDDIERKKADDQFKVELRDRQRKDWTTDDELTTKRKELYDKHFGEQAAPEIAPDEVNPQRMIAQEQGIGAQPESVPMPQTQALPQPAVVAPVVRPVNPPRAGMIPAVYTEAVKQTESRGRMNAIGPHIPGQGSAKSDMQVMDATSSSPGFGVKPAANSSMKERSRVGKDYYAALGDKYQDPALAAIAYNWGPGNADKWLAAGGDFSKLPRETQAYVGSVMTRGAVAQRGSGVRMASEQGAIAAPPPMAPASMPVNGIETPVQTRDTKPDRMTDVGNTMRYVLDNARLEVQYGKKDGTGLATLMKAADGIRKEGMAEAVALMDRGMYQEAQDLFNSKGDHTGATIVSAKDSQYTGPDGRVWPTKIVTMQKPDGSTRVVNTKQDQFLMMELSKQAELANDGERNQIAKDHYKDAREERALTRTDRLSERGELRADRQADRAENNSRYDATTPEGKLNAIEQVLGPLKPEERKEYQKKLLGIGKNSESRQNFYEDVVKEGVKAGTIDPANAGKEVSRLLTGDKVSDDENIVGRELAAAKSDPLAYSKKYAQAVQIMPPARLKELGFAEPVTPKAAPVKSSSAARAALGTLPTQDSRPPSPPPQMIQQGLTRVPNPAYADWMKQYGDAYSKQQSTEVEQQASEQRRADAYNPFQQRKL